MERYIGIDVHRDSSTICVLSAAGKRVRRDIVETNGLTLVSYIRKLSGTLHVCIEEGTWSEWLYEILSPHASELVVYQNVWTPGAKSDAIDAHGLAEKLRIGQAGPGVFKAAKRYRNLGEWARVYQALTQDTTPLPRKAISYPAFPTLLAKPHSSVGSAYPPVLPTSPILLYPTLVEAPEKRIPEAAIPLSPILA